MRLFLVLLLLLSGCAAGGDACRLERVAELPLRLVGKVPVVTVEINGRRASLVLDTGSDSTVVTRAAAARLGVAAGGETRRLGGAGGQTSVGVARVDRLAFGGVALEGVRVSLADAPGPPLDGLLGLDVLVAYELELDVPERRAVLYRARPCATARPDWAGEVVQLPVQQQARSGHLFVSVTVDGEPLRGMLDTGASVSTLSVQAAEDVRVTQRRLRQLPAARGQAVNAEGVAVRTMAFRELQVGTDVLTRPVMTIVDLPAYAGDLLVGEDYLGTRRVWFSFVLGRVFVSGQGSGASVQDTQPRPR